MNIKLGKQAAFSISIFFEKLYLVKMCPIFTGSHCLIFENEATSTDNQNSKFECIHHFPQIFSLFQIAHLVECEGLV